MHGLTSFGQKVWRSAWSRIKKGEAKLRFGKEEKVTALFLLLFFFWKDRQSVVALVRRFQSSLLLKSFLRGFALRFPCPERERLG